MYDKAFYKELARSCTIQYQRCNRIEKRLHNYKWSKIKNRYLILDKVRAKLKRDYERYYELAQGINNEK